MQRQQRLALLVFFVAYAAILCIISAHLSLWLDELIDLQQIRDLTAAQLIKAVPLNAGGTPLSYLARYAVIHNLGFSLFLSRLVSILSSLFAIAGMCMLGRQAGFRWPWLPAIWFALLPLHVRYSTESRPYALELALLIWTTVFFFKACCATTSLSFWVLHSILTCALLYTQPYGVFLVLGQMVWLFTTEGWRPRALISLAVAAVLFVPWAYLAVTTWKGTTDSHQTYAINWKSGLLVSRELLGAGYLGTLLVVTLTIYLVKIGQKKYVQLWLYPAAFAIVLPLVADQIFGYFVATRQMIAVLIPVAMLVAKATEQLFEMRNRRWAWTITSGVALLFAGSAINYIRKPREDWAAGARIVKERAESGACVIFAPPQSRSFYLFFQPDVAKYECREDKWNKSELLLAQSPYRSAEPTRNIQADLASHGYVPLEVKNQAGPKIVVYRRIRTNSPAP